MEDKRPAREVSVVIPVRNGAKFVRDAIESVLSQSGVTVELILVDNASTDGTAGILASYGSVLTVIREAVPGAARARNAGVRMAAREYLAFLDADDVWSAGKLEKQIAALDAAPGVGLVFGLGQEFCHGVFPIRKEPQPFLSASTLLCRRETFLRIGEFPEAAGGEVVAWYGWASSLGIQSYVLPEVVLRRRVHAANSSRDPKVSAGYVAAAKWLLDRRRGMDSRSGT